MGFYVILTITTLLRGLVVVVVVIVLVVVVVVAVLVVVVVAAVAVAIVVVIVVIMETPNLHGVADSANLSQLQNNLPTIRRPKYSRPRIGNLLTKLT